MEKGDPKMPINVDQAVTASVMAKRVGKGRTLIRTSAIPEYLRRRETA